jgi:hypothetical protein
MHRYAAWGLSAALAVGGLAPLAAADPVEPARKPWYGRLFGGSAPKPAPETEDTFAAATPRPPVLIAPLDPSVLTDALRAEQDAYLRRMAVCLRLREIADKLGDDDLLHQADELERQATALYHQRAARLGVKAPARTASADPIGVAVPPAAEPHPFREVKR